MTKRITLYELISGWHRSAGSILHFEEGPGPGLTLRWKNTKIGGVATLEMVRIDSMTLRFRNIEDLAKGYDRPQTWNLTEGCKAVVSSVHIGMTGRASVITVDVEDN